MESDKANIKVLASGLLLGCSGEESVHLGCWPDSVPVVAGLRSRSFAVCGRQVLDPLGCSHPWKISPFFYKPAMVFRIPFML